jgi:hypothetical protein
VETCLLCRCLAIAAFILSTTLSFCRHVTTWEIIVCFSLAFLTLKKNIRQRCLTTGLPLWSSDQSSWLQIQRSGFDSRPYQIFWEVVDLERGPLSLVSAIEEVYERNTSSSGSGPEIREYGRRDPLCWPRDTPLSEKGGTNFADKRLLLGRNSLLSV